MSCNITIGRRKNHCKNNLGGIKEIYIKKFEQYNFKDFEADLGAKLFYVPVSFFYKFELDTTTSFSESYKIDEAGNYYDISISTSFINLDYLTASELNALSNNNWHVIVKLNNDKFYFLGFENGLELTTLDVSSGSNLTDFQGYNLAFTGKEQYKGMLIDDLTSANIFVGFETAFIWGISNTNEAITDGNDNVIKAE